LPDASDIGAASKMPSVVGDPLIVSSVAVTGGVVLLLPPPQEFSVATDKQNPATARYFLISYLMAISINLRLRSAMRGNYLGCNYRKSMFEAWVWLGCI
jgi:hypothetical protein